LCRLILQSKVYAPGKPGEEAMTHLNSHFLPKDFPPKNTNAGAFA
jgi:hypothetical protein